MKKADRLWIGAVLCLFAGCGGGVGGGTIQPEVQLQGILDQAVSQGAPGAAAYIVDPDQGTQAGASGLACITPEIPMDPDRIFRIASITKTFTAAAIMLLAEDGVLPGIDVPVQGYVADLNIPNDDIITIRMLLGHTSGMADHENDDTAFGPVHEADRFRVWSPEELVPFAIEYQLQHPEIFDDEPGTRYRYSNTGYVVLAMIIERVTHLTYGQYIASRILEPLGLTNTFPADGPFLPEPFAHGYADPGNGALEDWSDSDESWDLGAGGMQSTVRDLTRWMTLLVGGSVVSAQSLQEMMTSGPSEKYGLGLEHFLNHGGWGHTGGTAGYFSIALCDPVSGFASAGYVTLGPPTEPFRTLYNGLAEFKHNLGN